MSFLLQYITIYRFFTKQIKRIPAFSLTPKMIVHSDVLGKTLNLYFSLGPVNPLVVVAQPGKKLANIPKKCALCWCCLNKYRVLDCLIEVHI